MSGNPYKDEKGHYTNKANDGGPCKHEGGSQDKLSSKQEERFNKKDELIKKYKEMGYANDEAQLNAEKDLSKFDEDYENDLKPAEKKKYYVGTLDGKYDDIIEATSPEEAEQIAQEKYGKYMGGDEVEVEELEDEDEDLDIDINDNMNSDNLNPNNPKYKGFDRSHITNAKEVDEGYTYTNSEGKEVKESIIEYIPYGALQDGDNKKLYGIVRNYDGSDAPDIGAQVTGSLESAKKELEESVKYGIQGSDRYGQRGQYDEDFFNMLNDKQYGWDQETKDKYSKKYGWDFNKPFKEHDFMKDDPYEKWKSERKKKNK